ncbi:hypothetical protein LPJ61_004446 [Coemansia biformis]|uniref:Peptide hydrolase n=1 Tax=Coemansia biformis TaxID=1286918 RepID=A0A9W7YB07_9FUNG|nr:hypothetical protein LPJ61_004446 [Coemansia biformis]
MKATLAALVVGVLAAAGIMARAVLYSDRRLIALGPDTREWMGEAQIHELVRNRRQFRDIIDAPPAAPVEAVPLAIPHNVTQQAAVNPLLKKVSRAVPEDVLAKLTAFPNRYYNSDNGRASSEFLTQRVKEYATNVTRFVHRFPQSSVIARLEGGSLADEIVVVSAHQDSINQENHTDRAPGADDNGSGTVTILETLRVLGQSGLRLKRSVEFHWYAGEEGGLLGSADVVQAYRGRKVVVDLNMDMTGVPASPRAVGIITDYTSADINVLLRQVVHAYTDLPTIDMTCGYACSDHASWNATGVRSAIPFESQFADGNSNIHTPADTIDTVDFGHLLSFVNIAIGFVVEVAGVE